MGLEANHRLHLQLGNLVTMEVDAIVNSTSPSLLEGGPVHQAVHAAAGSRLREECQSLGPCPPGDVRISHGYTLSAPFVLHAVPPVWGDGTQNEPEQLASCYQKALRLAQARGFRSLAFPSLGSGTQPQIPLDIAAPIAIRTILDFLTTAEAPEKVYLVCFDAPSYQAYQKALKEALP